MHLAVAKIIEHFSVSVSYRSANFVALQDLLVWTIARTPNGTDNSIVHIPITWIRASFSFASWWSKFKFHLHCLQTMGFILATLFLFLILLPCFRTVDVVSLNNSMICLEPDLVQYCGWKSRNSESWHGPILSHQQGFSQAIPACAAPLPRDLLTPTPGFSNTWDVPFYYRE